MWLNKGLLEVEDPSPGCVITDQTAKYRAKERGRGKDDREEGGYFGEFC